MTSYPRCVFCEQKNSAPSKEDVFAKWIARECPEGRFRVYREATPHKEAQEFRMRGHRASDTKTCTKCNNKRMSDMENKVKPILRPAIWGHVSTVPQATSMAKTVGSRHDVAAPAQLAQGYESRFTRSATARRTTSQRPHDRLSTLAVAAFASLVTYSFTTTHWASQFDNFRRTLEDHDELQQILDAQGLQEAGPHLEEHFIRDHFQGRRNGVFLDVGAHHYKDFSNTFFLESEYDWSGIAVEPQIEFAEDYTRFRPRTRLVSMFAADTDHGSVAFYVPAANPRAASSSAQFARQYGPLGKARDVPTATLNTLLVQAGITQIDFLSMDIELAEPKALAGFDIARYQPEFVCIEAHPLVRQSILEYFFAHGYVLVGKYLRADPNNLYFTRSKQRVPDE